MDLLTRYRPTVWEDVIGQDAAVKSLTAVLEEARARSFLFSGPSGCGKTTLARLVAKDVGCVRPKEVDAATYSGIEDMRQIMRGTNYVPLEGGASVVIVDECHMLSNSAWNAALKTIEEPPPGAVFCFCTTEPKKVPRTIETRCVHFELRSLKKEELRLLVSDVCEHEENPPPEAIRDYVAVKAEGSPRQALNLLAKCWACGSVEEARELLAEADEDTPEVRDLCQALMKGSDWTGLMKVVKPLKDLNPESVRCQVQGYFTKVAMGAKSDKVAIRAMEILEAFSDPYPGAGSRLAPVVLSCGRYYFGEAQ